MSAPLRPVEWKAEEYDHHSAPHEEWQSQILERFELKGDETVLDAGCGTGRLTKKLVERVPNGHVIGVDASAQMLEKAREHLGEDFDLRQQDLTRLEIPEKVDAVYSSAVFHWIQDHEALFRSLHGAMTPGARLEAQCGGDGNIVEIERALEALAGDERFSPYLRGEREAWNYASVEDTRLRLAPAGFSDIRGVDAAAAGHADGSAGLRFDRDPALAPRPAPQELHDSFVRAVLETAPRPLVVNYVRLNISASGVRPASGHIALLPGDGIGPEIVSAAVQGPRRRRRLHLRGAPRRRRLDRRERDRAHRRRPREVPQGRRRPARGGRRAEVGHDRPGQAAPRAGPPRPSQGPRPLREPPAGPPEPGTRRREPAPARDHPGHRHPRRARAHRRHLLRREEARAGLGVRPCVYTRAEIERIARVAFEVRRPPRWPRHLGGQGERPRNFTSLARGRDRRPRRLSPTSPSTTCSSTTPRCSSSPARAAST